jgi:hypothetical protein
LEAALGATDLLSETNQFIRQELHSQSKRFHLEMNNYDLISVWSRDQPGRIKHKGTFDTALALVDKETTGIVRK